MRKLFLLVFAALLVFLFASPKQNVSFAACNYCIQPNSAENPGPVRIDNTDFVNPPTIRNNCENLAGNGVDYNAATSSPCCQYYWGSGTVSKTVLIDYSQKTCTSGKTCDDANGTGCVGGSTPPPKCSKEGTSCFRNSDCAVPSESLCSNEKCVDANGHYFDTDGQSWMSPGTCGKGTTAVSCPVTGQDCSLQKCCIYSTDSCDSVTNKCVPNCADNLNGVACSGSKKCCNVTDTCELSTGKCIGPLPTPSINICLFTLCGPTPPPPSPPCSGTLAGGNCSNVSLAGIVSVNTDPQGFIRSLFGLILSLSGGIALLLIILSGYKILSSQGNPEALKGAREQLTAAIVGLLFVIFSIVILQIIGFNILRIPGFGG